MWADNVVSDVRGSGVAEEWVGAAAVWSLRSWAHELREPIDKINKIYLWLYQTRKMIKLM